jgi:hypothetical protein
MPLSRRTFLRGAGVALALPALDVFAPRARAADKPAVPRRMIAVQTNMGILPQHFTPAEPAPTTSRRRTSNCSRTSRAA